jgi:hypothetical protein
MQHRIYVLNGKEKGTPSAVESLDILFPKQLNGRLPVLLRSDTGNLYYYGSSPIDEPPLYENFSDEQD